MRNNNTKTDYTIGLCFNFSKELRYGQRVNEPSAKGDKLPSTHVYFSSTFSASSLSLRIWWTDPLCLHRHPLTSSRHITIHGMGNANLAYQSAFCHEIGRCRRWLSWQNASLLNVSNGMNKANVHIFLFLFFIINFRNAIHKSLMYEYVY